MSFLSAAQRGTRLDIFIAAHGGKHRNEMNRHNIHNFVHKYLWI